MTLVLLVTQLDVFGFALDVPSNRELTFHFIRQNVTVAIVFQTNKVRQQTIESLIQHRLTPSVFWPQLALYAVICVPLITRSVINTC